MYCSLDNYTRDRENWHVFVLFCFYLRTSLVWSSQALSGFFLLDKNGIKIHCFHRPLLLCVLNKCAYEYGWIAFTYLPTECSPS